MAQGPPFPNQHGPPHHGVGPHIDGPAGPSQFGPNLDSRMQALNLGSDHSKGQNNSNAQKSDTAKPSAQQPAKAVSLFEGWILRKAGNDLVSSKTSWDRIEKSRMPFSEEDLAKKVNSKNSKTSVMTEYTNLRSDTQRIQVDRLITDCNKIEKDPNKQWALAMIDTVFRKNKQYKGNQETTAIHVILKRSSRAALGNNTQGANGVIVDLKLPQKTDTNSNKAPGANAMASGSQQTPWDDKQNAAQKGAFQHPQPQHHPHQQQANQHFPHPPPFPPQGFNGPGPGPRPRSPGPSFSPDAQPQGFRAGHPSPMDLDNNFRPPNSQGLPHIVQPMGHVVHPEPNMGRPVQPMVQHPPHMPQHARPMPQHVQPMPQHVQPMPQNMPPMHQNGLHMPQNMPPVPPPAPHMVHPMPHRPQPHPKDVQPVDFDDWDEEDDSDDMLRIEVPKPKTKKPSKSKDPFKVYVPPTKHALTSRPQSHQKQNRKHQVNYDKPSARRRSPGWSESSDESEASIFTPSSPSVSTTPSSPPRVYAVPHKHDRSRHHRDDYHHKEHRSGSRHRRSSPYRQPTHYAHRAEPPRPPLERRYSQQEHDYDLIPVVSGHGTYRRPMENRFVEPRRITQGPGLSRATFVADRHFDEFSDDGFHDRGYERDAPRYIDQRDRERQYWPPPPRNSDRRRSFHFEDELY